MTDAQLFPTRAQAAMSAFRSMIEEISAAVAGQPLNEAVRFVIDRGTPAARCAGRMIRDELRQRASDGRRIVVGVDLSIAGHDFFGCR